MNKGCFIEKILNENKRLKKVIKEYSTKFYAIGAPLNDNVLNFNGKQKLYLHNFANNMKAELRESDE